jgi:hypothetical protein
MISPETKEALRSGLVPQRNAANWSEAADGCDLSLVADVHDHAFYVYRLRRKDEYINGMRSWAFYSPPMRILKARETGAANCIC